MVIGRYVALFCALIFFCLGMVCTVSGGDALIVDRFEGDLAAWEVQEFEGTTSYRLVREGTGQVLEANSSSAASGLIRRLEFDPREYPRIRWRWRIEHTLSAGNAHSKEGDDYAARIYVVFPHWIKPLTRSINYIWANQLPRGEAVANAYFSRAMMLAVESGNQQAGQWLTEERNLVEDYRRLFGEEPPLAGAIAIMTDTDNTGEATRAWYDDLILLPPLE